MVLSLQEYGNFLTTNHLTTAKYLLFCQGSEQHISKLDEQFDLSFTSPPYFNLEKYSEDSCQSTRNYDNYSLWLTNFVQPTIENTYKYLKIGGYAMINIKNLTRDGKQPLYDDWFRIFSNQTGFQFVETFEMNIQSKKNYIMNTNYTPDKYKGFKEPIMVFKKIK